MRRQQKLKISNIMNKEILHPNKYRVDKKESAIASDEISCSCKQKKIGLIEIHVR
jgi:hypothetical protein